MTTVVVEGCRGYGRLAVVGLTPGWPGCWPCHLWEPTSLVRSILAQDPRL